MSISLVPGRVGGYPPARAGVRVRAAAPSSATLPGASPGGSSGRVSEYGVSASAATASAAPARNKCSVPSRSRRTCSRACSRVRGCRCTRSSTRSIGLRPTRRHRRRPRTNTAMSSRCRRRPPGSMCRDNRNRWPRSAGLLPGPPHGPLQRPRCPGRVLSPATRRPNQTDTLPAALVTQRRWPRRVRPSPPATCRSWPARRARRPTAAQCHLRALLNRSLWRQTRRRRGLRHQRKSPLRTSRRLSSSRPASSRPAPRPPRPTTVPRLCPRPWRCLQCPGQLGPAPRLTPGTSHPLSCPPRIAHATRPIPRTASARSSSRWHYGQCSSSIRVRPARRSSSRALGREGRIFSRRSVLS